jgi:hypothetical protein
MGPLSSHLAPLSVRAMDTSFTVMGRLVASCLSFIIVVVVSVVVVVIIIIKLKLQMDFYLVAVVLQ